MQPLAVRPSTVCQPAVQQPAARVRGLRSVPAGPLRLDALASDGGGSGDLARSLELLKSVCLTAVDDAGMRGFRAAADFAANVEEISRAVEYLQVVAAGSVDRTRREATAAARSGAGGSGSVVGWVTGWGGTAVREPAGWATGKAGQGETGPEAARGRPSSAVPDPADDGCRNAAEFLRSRLRISVAEARRRMALAADLLPRVGFAGHTEPPVRPELAAAVAAGMVASRPATIITMALDRVRDHATGDTTARMEHVLTHAAVEHDADFLSRMARQWIDGIDQDGSEPSEEELRRRQGVFLRRARRGLHHLEIFATPDQYESLLTVMNTATNPRTKAGAAGEDNTADSNATGDTLPGPDLDRRTRPQRLLDGLVGGCKAGLTTEALPIAGGLRPQVMVTIDYRDLLDRLEHATNQGPWYRSSSESPASTPGIPGTGSFTFTGPVNAATVRKIACDADIIPVVLGSEGRILDIGRTTRIFPPHIRKTITARDQGCAFPGCTIPAPWCEAHHITYWSHGGSTSSDNGTLLCSHHHHLIHKEQWTIQVKTGIPWFIPPPHIDPRQKRQRNNYFRLEC
nr:HNH endonuclease signature motif containing protein [Arthrobacter oryzae]